MLIDHYGRSITYLRISLTDQCNLRCAYCIPNTAAKWIPQENLLTVDEIIRVVKAAASLGVSKIRLTGGEPLIRPDVIEIVQRISAISDIKDIGLTTNAILLEKFAKPLVDAGLKRVNISLDTLDAHKFHRITRYGHFSKTWNGILAAEKAGLIPIKLNTVVVGGFNDDELPSLARLTLSHPWQVRFIELMPVGNQQDWGDDLPSGSERYISVQKMHKQLADLNLEPVDGAENAGPARIFRIPGAPGSIGFISPLGEHFCESCNRLRLTADGSLRACLLIDGEIPIRDALRKGGEITAILQQAVDNKPQGHELAMKHFPETRRMSQIGG
jgi:cyclic pyranopterin phosphate synthase